MTTIDHDALVHVLGGCSDHPPNVVCKGLINICGNTSTETKTTNSAPKPAAGGTPVSMPQGNK